MKNYIILFCVLMLLCPQPLVIAEIKYDSKRMVKKISKVKSKSELKEIFEKNNQIPFGEVESNLIHLRKDLCDVFRQPLKDNNFRAIINFIKDEKLNKKYKLQGIDSRILTIVIKSDHYSQTQKEYAVESLKVIPFKLSSLKKYFSKQENQKNPLFNKYINWCLSKDYFYPIFDLFANLDLELKTKVLEKMDPNSESNSDYNRKAQINFLKGVLESTQYNEKIRLLVREKLSLLVDDHKAFIASLLKSKGKDQVGSILKKFERQKDYKVIEKLLFQSKSNETRKTILEYLIENCELESEKIGNILANVVVSPKFKNELKKLAMSQDAFTYNTNYRKSLCQYFSKNENQEASLYKQFIEFAISESDQEESMEFILKFFDSFKDKEKLRITKNINLSYTGDLEFQFDFFKKILKDKKYPDNLKKVAEEKLAKLEANKQSFAEEMRPRSGKEMATACIDGFEKIVKLKVIEPSRKGYVFSDEEKEMIKSLFKDVEKTLETYKSVYKLDDKTIREAQDKLKELRKDSDSILTKQQQKNSE